MASQFLLSGLAHCGYCETSSSASAASRLEAQGRRALSNSYRYYQCESRTNQSVCGYHTQRADDLEGEVRTALTAAPRQAIELPVDALPMEPTRTIGVACSRRERGGRADGSRDT